MPFFLKASFSSIMCSCLRVFNILTYLRMTRLFYSWASLSLNFLIATSSLVYLFLAFNTTPYSPSPIWSRISYLFMSGNNFKKLTYTNYTEYNMQHNLFKSLVAWISFNFIMISVCCWSQFECWFFDLQKVNLLFWTTLSSLQAVCWLC